MEVFKFSDVPNRAYVCLKCFGDVADLFKTKDLLNEVKSKMRELEPEMATVKTKVDVLEEKTNFKENEELRAAVWEQVK